jgi:sirohydrochlorin ferrochelatase
LSRRYQPVLVAVAHGSRDPRHAQTVAELGAAVRSRNANLEVEIAYLDLSEPRLPDVLRQLDTAGVRQATAVPLLLTPAYHAKTDLPRALRRARHDHPRLEVTAARVLGPSPALVTALERRLREAGIWPGDLSIGIVLGAAGTSDPAARRQIEQLAAEWASTGWSGVACAYASAGGPDVAAAATGLRRQGADRVVLAPYVLAPGILPDRLFSSARAARLDALAPVLGAAPEVVSLIIQRYEEITLLTASA